MDIIRLSKLIENSPLVTSVSLFKKLLDGEELQEIEVKFQHQGASYNVRISTFYEIDFNNFLIKPYCSVEVLSGELRLEQTSVSLVNGQHNKKVFKLIETIISKIKSHTDDKIKRLRSDIESVHNV